MQREIERRKKNKYAPIADFISMIKTKQLETFHRSEVKENKKRQGQT